MNDKEREDLVAYFDAEEEECLSPADLHPYDSRVTWKKGNTVPFPDIARFTNYILRHLRADILDEIFARLCRGLLASVCRSIGFSCSHIIRQRFWIERRMDFWRVNRYEFIADLTIALKVDVCKDDVSEEHNFTLYASLNFCIDEDISYDFASLSLQRPSRDLIKLDDFLIPILDLDAVNKAAEALWFEYLPEALRDSRMLNPYLLAEKMKLKIVRHKLYRNHKTRSVLYWVDREVMVTPKGGDDKTPPNRIKVTAGTIVINENLVHCERQLLDIFHECFHDEYHWLFFRFQEKYNDNLLEIPTIRKHKNQGKEPKNPLPIMEWEAWQGARALRLPTCILRPLIEQYRHAALLDCNHAGRAYESIIRSISAVTCASIYLVRARLLQLGHWRAQGAFNYIRTGPNSGHYINAYMFAREGCPDTSHALQISPLDAFKLYKSNAVFRAHIDTGNYVYVDGHICLNDEAYVVKTPSGPRMTDWANRHIDECCLRFENIYEINEAYVFRLNSVNCDEEYNRHYFDFVAKGKELPLKETLRRQQEIIASLPRKPGEALKALMKLAGNVTQDRMAELTLMSRGAVRLWMNEEYSFRPETAVRIIVALHLPPWLSRPFLAICGVTLQDYGIHLLYHHIIECRYMDTLGDAISLLESSGFENKFKDKE